MERWKEREGERQKDGEMEKIENRKKDKERQKDGEMERERGIHI